MLKEDEEDPSMIFFKAHEEKVQWKFNGDPNFLRGELKIQTNAEKSPNRAVISRSSDDEQASLSLAVRVNSFGFAEHLRLTIRSEIASWCEPVLTDREPIDDVYRKLHFRRTISDCCEADTVSSCQASCDVARSNEAA